MVFVAGQHRLDVSRCHCQASALSTHDVPLQGVIAPVLQIVAANALADVHNPLIFSDRMRLETVSAVVQNNFVIVVCKLFRGMTRDEIACSFLVHTEIKFDVVKDATLPVVARRSACLR